MKYECRGRVQSIKLDREGLSFRFKAKTQLEYSENETPDEKKFNILLPDQSTSPYPINCVAIATVVEITANNIFLALLAAIRDEDATIVVEHDPQRPDVYALWSIKVGP